MKEKVLLVISDLHCGSDVGLLPERVEMDDGQMAGHGSNPWQKWLWKSFKEGMQWAMKVIGRDDFGLILTGDLIEGIHHGSDEVVAAKMVEHLAIARAAVGGIIQNAETTLVVRGTECHTRDFESIFAKDYGLGKAHDFIQTDFNGCLLDARHHMPVTSRAHLEASAMSIVIANNRTNAVRSGHAPPRIMLRGHRHLHGFYSDGESVICVTGAWQGLTRHGRKVVADSSPRPSMIILDARNTNRGDLPAIHQRVFNPPQSLVVHSVC